MHALSTIAEITAEVTADPSLLPQAREILAVRADPKNGRNPGTQARSQAWLDAHPVEVQVAKKSRTRKVAPVAPVATTSTTKVKTVKPGSQAWIANYRLETKKLANQTFTAVKGQAGISAAFKAHKAVREAREALLAESLA